MLASQVVENLPASGAVFVAALGGKQTFELILLNSIRWRIDQPRDVHHRGPRFPTHPWHASGRGYHRMMYITVEFATSWVVAEENHLGDGNMLSSSSASMGEAPWQESQTVGNIF